MGQTNIRSGGAILQKASRSGEDTALIPEFQKYVLITGNDFSIDDIQRYWHLLKYGHSGLWNKNGPGLRDCQKVEADQPSQIPMVHISAALKPGVGVNPPLNSVELVYFIVVEGRNGSIRSKLVYRTDLHRVGTDILWECVNGYSVVFSGAMLKTDWMQRPTWHTEVNFERVKDKNELVRTTDMDSRVIKIWC
jgi:hypothetical protein